LHIHDRGWLPQASSSQGVASRAPHSNHNGPITLFPGRNAAQWKQKEQGVPVFFFVLNGPIFQETADGGKTLATPKVLYYFAPLFGMGW
jgi:hypothetical protein